MSRFHNLLKLYIGPSHNPKDHCIGQRSALTIGTSRCSRCAKSARFRSTHAWVDAAKQHSTDSSVAQEPCALEESFAIFLAFRECATPHSNDANSAWAGSGRRQQSGIRRLFPQARYRPPPLGLGRPAGRRSFIETDRHIPRLGNVELEHTLEKQRTQ